MNTFVAELNQLKALEMRYKEENSDIQRRIDQEGGTNVEFTGQIRDLEVKIKHKEEQI